MLPVLRLGPFVIPVAPLTLIAAFIAIQEVGDRAGRRLKLPEGVISSAALWAFGAGLVAARLGYVARYFESYVQDSLQIFALNYGTLDVTTGVIAGLITGLAYLQRRNVNLRAFGDALAPTLALGLAVVSIGNLLTGDAYGAVARGLPWAITLWGEPRHPAQIYELGAYLAIFLLLWLRTPRLNLFQGGTFLLAIALLVGTRVLLEPFRGDSVAGAMGLRMAQVIALLVMTGAALLLARNSSTATSAPSPSTSPLTRRAPRRL